jgi:hypothetical protein
MKFGLWLFILAFLLSEGACKRKNEDFICPQVISPVNSTVFHSGDTISILLFLPPAIQNDSAFSFAEVYSNYNSASAILKLDTFLYPTIWTGHYGKVEIVLKASGNSVDTDHIGTGIGNYAGGLYCNGITIYVQP